MSHGMTVILEHLEENKGTGKEIDLPVKVVNGVVSLGSSNPTSRRWVKIAIIQNLYLFLKYHF